MITKINHYAQYSRISSKPKKNVCHIQHFNPSLPPEELFNLRTEMNERKSTGNKSFQLIEISQIRNYEAGSMPLNIANYLKHFRSFVLEMLKGGLGFIRCKSYQAAVRYSNLGGKVAMVRNTGGAIAWGVVK